MVTTAKTTAPPVRMTATHVDKSLAKRRAYEAQVRELLVAGAEADKLNYTAGAEIRLLNQRRQKEVNRVITETALDNEITWAEQHTKNRERSFQQNKELASVLEKQRLEKEKQEREIQRICESSDELKDLERRLKIAYVNKERAAQHVEQILMKKFEREQEQAMEDYMEKQRQLARQKDVEKSLKKKDAIEKLKDDIQKQIRDREEHQREAEREAERDKERIDAIIAQVNAEDQAEIEERLRRKGDTRKMLMEYQIQHQRDVEERRRKEREEEEKIRRYQESLAARDVDVKRKKEEKKAIQDAMIAKIVAEAKKKQAEENEMRMLQELLIDEEAEAARRAADKARKEKELRDRLDMIRHNQEQIRLKEEQRVKDEAEEKRLIDLMKKKFAEDEQREREEAERRRKEKHRYQRLIEEQQEESRRLFEQEKDKAVAELRAAEQYEDFKKQVVAEARKRLLEEHGAKLAGYLPKGVIRNEDEKKIMDPYLSSGPPQSLLDALHSQNRRSSTTEYM